MRRRLFLFETAVVHYLHCGGHAGQGNYANCFAPDAVKSAMTMAMRPWNRPGIWILLVGLLTGGCALGPNPRRPDQNVVDEQTPYRNAESNTSNETASGIGTWWRHFDDPQTDALVDEALKRNQDLQAAAARVLEAEALLGVAVGKRLPEIEGQLDRDRSQRTFEFTGDRFASRSTTWTAGVSVSWQADLFGRLRRGQERAALEWQASRADREALMHSVVADVVRTRAQIATLGRQLAIARANTASWKQTYETIRRRFDNGLSNALELNLAEENLAASQSREPELAFRLKAARHALDVLTGRRPGSGESRRDTLGELPPGQTPPTGLPIQLLDRRPDLRHAELVAMAEQAGIGMAMAEMFPDVTLTASGGYQGSELGDLFKGAETQIWSYAGRLAAKLFQGGALRANVDAARARAQTAAHDYVSRLLRAMREVEDALVREQTARQSYQRLVVRVDKAQQAERIARRRYTQGVETLMTVLETERRRHQAEQAMIEAQQTVWEARVDLCLALGGDWRIAPPEMTARQLKKRYPLLDTGDRAAKPNEKAGDEPTDEETHDE